MSQPRWVAAIGAGREQEGAIRAAQRAGCRVVALDGDPTAPGLSIADAAVVVDLRDPRAVLNALRPWPVRAVAPAPVGRILGTIGAVNDALGMRGPSADSAMCCADKVRFHAALAAADLPRAEQRVASGREAIVRAVDEVGLPCVLKPARGSGSRGVVLVEPGDDVEKAISAHLEVEPETTLVETALQGPEVGVDAVVRNGVLHVVLVRDKELTPPPHRQVLAYTAPSVHDPAPIEAVLQAASTAVGLSDAMLHADVIMTAGGPVVVEMAPRPAGLLLAERLVPALCDVDWMAWGVLLMLGEAPQAVPRPQRAGALRFLEARDGLVAAVPDVTRLEAMPGVVHAAVWCRVGDRLAPVRQASDVLARGVVITVGPTPHDANMAARVAVASYSIRLEEPIDVVH